jgi:hypothetical protein
MLISDYRDFLYRVLKAQYYIFALDELFDVFPTTHDKIICNLTNLVLEEDPAYFHSASPSERFAPLTSKGAVLPAAVNTVAFALTFAKYALLYFFYRFVLRGRNSGIRKRKSGNTDFVFINSAGGVDRLVGSVGDLFAGDAYRMLYVVTSHVRKLMDRKRKRPDIEFIEPQMPGKNPLRVGLTLLFTKGSAFCFQIFHRLHFRPRRVQLRIALQILNYLYSMVIYHHWASDRAEKLVAEHNAAVFVFDIDEASKELMLADALRRRGATTLLLQHGILTDPNRYVPTCRWMACTSERERRALISLGVDKSRLVVVGQSLQTLDDSFVREVDNTSRYPLLILAGNGPGWLQNVYLDMLRQSKRLVGSTGLYVRLHPAFRGKAKRKWTAIEGFRVSDKNESLGQSLARSDLVITLVASVRQGRPTICCVPDNHFVPEWHGFLYDLPAVRVAKTSAKLDEILVDNKYGKYKKYHFSDSELQKLDYVFGNSDTKKNLMNFLAFLSEEAHRNLFIPDKKF